MTMKLLTIIKNYLRTNNDGKCDIVYFICLILSFTQITVCQVLVYENRNFNFLNISWRLTLPKISNSYTSRCISSLECRKKFWNNLIGKHLYNNCYICRSGNLFLNILGRKGWPLKPLHWLLCIEWTGLYRVVIQGVFLFFCSCRALMENRENNTTRSTRYMYT